MWNIKASNRVLDLKWKQEAQRKHLKSLKSMKAQVNTSAPRRYSFLDSRPKSKQLKYERQRDIDQHNSMLVGKMLNMTSDIKNGDVFFKESLNSTYNRQVGRQIEDNNMQLVRRLQSARSQYSQRGMAKGLREYDRVKDNMAFSRMDPYYDLDINSRQSGQAELKRSRPFSAIK